jgi:hypothetical protein
MISVKRCPDLGEEVAAEGGTNRVPATVKSGRKHPDTQ